MFSVFETQNFDSEKQFGLFVQKASYVYGGTFSSYFFQQVITCIVIFRSWAKFCEFERKNFGFCRNFCLGFKNCIPHAQKIVSRKNCAFLKKIFLQLISDFEPQELDSKKQFGMFVNTASCVSARTYRRTSGFFKKVYSRLFIFRIWSKKLLSPMETPWHACQICVLRDQRDVIWKFCFKVKKTKFFVINFGTWVKDYETIGCVFFGRAVKNALCFSIIKNFVEKKTYIF